MATIPTFQDGGVLHGSDLAFLETPPQCGVYQITAQTFAVSGTSYLMSWDTLGYDTDATMWTAGVPSHITFNTPGKWRVKAQLMWLANTTGIRQVDIRKNSAASPTGGARVGLGFMQASSTASQVTVCQAEVMLYGIVAGDYIEIFGSQTSGGSLALYNNYTGALAVWCKWEGA